jgi:hypothetical protein
VLSFVPSLALADEPSLVDWARHRVDEGLVKPLAEQESSHFSRSRPVPHERRVRVIQATTTLDKRGRLFVPFAIDVRYGPVWHENDIVGCAYRGSGELFVKKGDQYRPAAFLLGKNLAAVAGVCEAAPSARS